jgi:hypothetical protein
MSKPSKVLFDGAERAAAGKGLREKVPRSSHTECRWSPRRDPIATLLKSREGAAFFSAAIGVPYFMFSDRVKRAFLL